MTCLFPRRFGCTAASSFHKRQILMCSNIEHPGPSVGYPESCIDNRKISFMLDKVNESYKKTQPLLAYIQGIQIKTWMGGRRLLFKDCSGCDTSKTSSIFFHSKLLSPFLASPAFFFSNGWSDMIGNPLPSSAKRAMSATMYEKGMSVCVLLMDMHSLHYSTTIVSKKSEILSIGGR